MPELPPTAEILDALKHAAAPSAGAAGLVFALGLLLAWGLSQLRPFDWRSAASSLAVLALAAGLAAGNHFRGVFPFRAYPEPDAKWWHWVWPALGVLLAAELVARLPRFNPGLGYLVRLAAFAAGPCFLIQDVWAGLNRPPENIWWIPVLLGLWVVLREAGEQGPGVAMPAAVAVAAGGAAIVLLHQKTHGLADVALFLACALATVATIAFATKSDGSAAAAVGAIALAMLFLVSESTAYKPLPRWIPRLVAFAPFALGACLLPGFCRISDLRFATPLRVAFVALPVVAAVVWAMKAAPLEFGTAENW